MYYCRERGFFASQVRILSVAIRLCEVQMAAKKLLILFMLCRFLAIVVPLRHMSWCRGGYLTVRRVLIICLLVWGLAAFAAYTRESTVYSLFATFKSPV
jgi:hypothetical protein